MDDLPVEPRRVFGLPQQRRKAVEILNHCYSSDLLDLIEFEARLALIEKASTLDDLDRVLADIPEEHHHPGEVSSGLSETETVVGRFSTKKIADGILLTKVLDAQVSMGTLVLDYRNLTLPPGVMEVRLSVDMATCKILLPDGVQVQNRLQDNLSTVRETPDFVGPRTPVTILKLTGEVRLSTVKIQRRSRFSVWLSGVRGPKALP